MAIAFDAASSSTANASTVTFSHTCSGSDRVLVVGTSHRYNNKTTSVTYNGVNLTKWSENINSNICGTQLWYLVAPSTGANNIIVTQSSTERIVVGASSWTGVNQTTPLGTAVLQNGTSSSPSVNVSSSSSEVVIDVLAALDDAGITATVGTSQTQRWNDSAASGGIAIQGCGSSETGASTTTMSWSLSAAVQYSQIAAALQPGTADPAPGQAAVTATANTAGARVDLAMTMPSDSDVAEYEVRFLTSTYPATNRSDGTVVVSPTSTTPNATPTFNHTSLTNGTRYFYRVFVKDSAGTWNTGRTATAVAATRPTFLQRYTSDGTPKASGDVLGANPILEYQLASANFETGKNANFRLRTGDDAVTPPTTNTTDYVSTSGGSTFRYEDPASSGTFVNVPTTGLTSTYWGRKLRIYTSETNQRSASLRVEQPAASS